MPSEPSGASVSRSLPSVLAGPTIPSSTFPVDGVLCAEGVTIPAFSLAGVEVRPMGNGVAHVLTASAVSEIVGRVVQVVPVQMANVHSCGLGSKVEERNNVMDVDQGFLAADGGVHDVVLVPLLPAEEDAEPVATLASHARDDLLTGGVEAIPLRPRNRQEAGMVMTHAC